ncbi:hypothetical protein AB0B12_32420 [Streptomyces sp. NPDC044780]|uniref:hypothetical protein n=1 Tax=unclassified Streptomyces TaxID=2593676 RepID=UPI003407F17F
MRHFRGPLHRLAPLPFERTSPAAAALGGRPGPEGPAGGERVLGVPIAADGPLPQAGCDASLRAARDFLTRHFPDEPCRFATYSSWLLAPGSWRTSSPRTCRQRRRKAWSPRISSGSAVVTVSP